MDNPQRRRTMRRMAIILLMMEFYRMMIDYVAIMNDEDMDSIMTACRLLSVEVSSILTERVTPLRVRNYVERIIPGQTALQFRENFRMTPDIFEVVLREFSPKLLAINKFSPVTKLMDPRKQLLSVLWLLATPDSYRSIAERFDMGKSSLHRSFIHVVKVVISKSQQLIKWPQGREQTTAEKFKKFAGIPGVLGAIDGTYVPIKAPEEYPERYVNRKCYHAITLQAICDADLMFTDAYVGYPSSVSDHRIFKNSDIYQNVINRRINIPPNHFIIGDKAYPVLNWCIPPFIERSTLTNNQKNFNVAVSKTRQCIERAFALLKGRFRRLKYLDMSMTSFISPVILACCVLHNLCLLKGRDKASIEKFIKEGMPSVDGEEINDNESNDIGGESDGRQFRDRIMLEMTRR